MGATKIQICNLASLKLGAPIINSLTENSEHTVIINYVYEFMVEEVLEAHDWDFAIARSSALALAVSDPIGWSYGYAKPSGAVRVICMADDTSFLPAEPFAVEGDYIYTNLETAYCKYVGTVSDPLKFSQLFVDALAWRIAAEAAYRVTGKREKANEMWDGFYKALARAEELSSLASIRSTDLTYTDEIINAGVA